jgi:putative transposase
MGHKPRLQYAGLYHVFVRSNAEEHICRDHGDYSALLTLIAGCGLRCHWFCLMPTHYHALFSIQGGELSQAVHRINRRYATAFNRRYRRHGHVFDSPYSANPVDTDEYLDSVICYIALNPPDPATWRWSSYHGFVGLSEPFSFVDPSPVFTVFRSADRLREVVEERWQKRNRAKPKEW